MKGKQKIYEKGITLIALVITIIVLLILAGVTLSIVFNEGIISKSQTAVDKYSEESAREKLSLALFNYKMGVITGEAGTGENQKKLEDYIKEIGTIIAEDDTTYTIVVDGYKFIVENKNYEIKSSEKFSGEITPTEPEGARYIITFDANGGTIDVATKEVFQNSKYGELPIPTKEGYAFEGWYTATTNGTEVTSSTKVTISENQTLYAVWQIKTLKFTGSGNPYFTINNPGGLSIPQGQATNKIEVTIPEGGYIVEATARGGVNNGSISFIDSTGIETSIAKYSGTEVTNTYEITTEGALNLQGAFEIYIKLISTNIPVPLEFDGYTVIYNFNGGTCRMPRYVYDKIMKKGDSITVYNFGSSLTKTGYTLLGWSEDKNATTATYANAATITPTKDMVLYAVWKSNT